jgi:hypothetical protein
MNVAGVAPSPQTWQTRQISGRKFAKNEEIFADWEEIFWVATGCQLPQKVF